jgi:hypothetical protein
MIRRWLEALLDWYRSTHKARPLAGALTLEIV